MTSSSLRIEVQELKKSARSVEVLKITDSQKNWHWREAQDIVQSEHLLREELLSMSGQAAQCLA